VFVHPESKSVIAVSYQSDGSDSLDHPRSPLVRKVYHGSWEEVEKWSYRRYIGYCEELGRIIIMCQDVYVVIELTG
jgi:hypothetical protein